MSTRCLFVCALFAIAANPHLDTSPKTPKLDGEWRLIAIEFQGTSWQLADDAAPRWLIHGDQLIMRNAPGNEEKVTLRWNWSRKPAAVDVMDGETTKLRGIFQLSNERLILCVSPEGRPADFTPRPETEERRLVLERRPFGSQP